MRLIIVGQIQKIFGQTMTLCKPFIEKRILLFYDRILIDNLQEKETLQVVEITFKDLNKFQQRFICITQANKSMFKLFSKGNQCKRTYKDYTDSCISLNFVIFSQPSNLKL